MGNNWTPTHFTTFPRHVLDGRELPPHEAKLSQEKPVKIGDSNFLLNEWRTRQDSNLKPSDP